MKNRIIELVGLVVSIFIAFLPGMFGSQFRPGEWYAALAKPVFTPPGWVFPVVWPILYFIMGVAAWMVWKRRGFHGAKLALACYAIQLVLNGVWSWLFFGLKRPDLAFYEIIALWLAVAATLMTFDRHHRTAAAIMLPYLAWITFATVLNGAIWWINP